MTGKIIIIAIILIVIIGLVSLYIGIRNAVEISPDKPFLWDEFDEVYS